MSHVFVTPWMRMVLNNVGTYGAVSIASQACFMLPYDQNSLFGIVATKV
jgi:hypothetical protein